ncbi:MAG TPA: tRNA lysidine(34) synthetase TilS [Noviherbaspirillum sp.]
MSTGHQASLADAFERALGAIQARVSAFAHGIAVAYSGGLDSSALLHLASAYARAHGLPLYAFHIHHGLSANADAWQSHCEHACAGLGVRFDARRVTLTDSRRDGTEQAARICRYAALGDLCRAHGVSLLLTAHHLDDQAETVLLRLLRGSGVAGLCGMEAANIAPELLGDSELVIARPLLGISRAELERYVSEQGIAYVDDESNADTRFARNALRHDIMPSLSRHFPGFQGRIARSARHMGASQQVLDEVAALDLDACSDGDGIDLVRLKRLSDPRIDNLLRYWLSRRGVRMPSTAWLAQMREQLMVAREDARVRVIHADGEIHRHRGRIFLAPRISDATLAVPPAAFRWGGEGRIHFPQFGGALHFCDADEGIDAEWLAAQDMQIRLRGGGEVLKLASNRPTRSLKHHYQALNIPAWERLQLPVVLAANRLVFAAGIGMNWGGVPIAREKAVSLSWKKDPT